MVRFKGVSAARNKELTRSMWAEAAKGKFEGFLNGYSDEVRYTIIGTTRFSGTFNGKQELLERVLVPMMTDLETSAGLEANTLDRRRRLRRGSGARSRAAGQVRPALQQHLLHRLQAGGWQGCRSHGALEHRAGDPRVRKVKVRSSNQEGAALEDLRPKLFPCVIELQKPLVLEARHLPIAS
jgi:hypothetical protein